MDVPEDFAVGVPHTFGWQVGADSRQTPDGVWVEVDGGGLPCPLLVRIDRAHDGRFIVTGLLIGRDEHREIDWATLRRIKPASIVNMIFAGFDPKLPDKLVDEKWHLQWEDDAPITAAELAAAGGDTANLEPKPVDEHVANEFYRAMIAHDIWRKLGGSHPAPSVTEVTRPRSSVATNLTEFAETYRKHYTATPRRATTSTANELRISRATAIRRIKECRDLGLIPPQEDR